PVFNIRYGGFLNGDGPSNITPPTAGTSATLLSNVGTYPIILTGGSSGNYTIVNNNGTLTINPATLTVKADDKTICLFDRLPKFTSTISGFKNGDASTIIYGPDYKLSRTSCNFFLGNYTITPSGLRLSNPANYNIVYLPGTLHVVFWPTNYYRQDSSAVASGIASPVNLNDIAGINQLATGQPTVSYTNPNKGAMISKLTEIIEANTIITSAYPNPTSGKVTLQINSGTISPNIIIITDDIGRTYSSKSARVYSNNVQVDLTGFRSGVYFIKIKVNDIFKTFRVIKK
ncbi:MAG TPA: MBG domain-containing protein, partial [Hanamia sp.]